MSLFFAVVRRVSDFFKQLHDIYIWVDCVALICFLVLFYCGCCWLWGRLLKGGKKARKRKQLKQRYISLEDSQRAFLRQIIETGDSHFYVATGSADERLVKKLVKAGLVEVPFCYAMVSGASTNPYELSDEVWQLLEELGKEGAL
jgi:hypothetical protein